MKNLKYFLGGLIVASIALSACSKDNVKLATYKFQGKEYSVKIGDVKQDLVQYLPYNTGLVTDTESQREYVFQQHILPNLVYFYQLQNGFTNSTNFISAFSNIGEKVKLFALYDSGYNIVSNEFAKQKFDIARASHILIKVPTTTNINGVTVTLDSNTIDRLWQEKLSVAQNILDFLKNSRQLDKDFAQAVADYSEDLGSKSNGGDLGYFTRGRMVPEFEEAVFNFNKKGLIPELVKTQFGYHIIFVTDPASKKSMDQIKELLDPQMAYYIQGAIRNTYFSQLEASNKTLHYEIQYAENGSTEDGVSVDGVFYKPDQIPLDVVMLQIFGKDYTWGDCRRVIEMFVPSFATNMTANNIFFQMTEFNNLMLYVSRAQTANVERSADFKKTMEDMMKDTMKRIAFQMLAEDWIRQSEALATEDALKQYYENMKQMGTTVTNILNSDGTYTSRQLTYNQMQQQVRDEFVRNRQYEMYDSWRASAMSNFEVTYNEDGFNTLKDVLQKELDKFLKSDEGQAMQQQMMQQQLLQMMQQQGGQIQQ